MTNDTMQMIQRYMKETLSFEKYLETVSEAEEYKSYLGCFDGIFSGMFKWPSENNPENWGGPFPGNYVAFIVNDHSTEKLETPMSIFNLNKDYIEHSIFSYPQNITDKFGFNSSKNSTLSDDDIIKIYNEMTDEERILTEIKKAEYIASRDNNPYNLVSTVNPYSLYLFGTDDCSYTRVFSDDIFLVIESFSIFNSRNWFCINDRFIFTN